jgi:hypothetical protein
MKFPVLAIVLFACIALHAQPNRNDVIMDEIFADPNPPVPRSGGLPGAEFIELKNTSLQAVNLNGWKLGKASGAAGIGVNFILQPDSFVIICSSASAAAFSRFGPSLGVAAFPPLGNDGDLIFLQSRQGKVIHAVEYSKAWYANAVKSEGGWTLEMIDTKNACSGSANWKASEDPAGGTPGKKNSTVAVNKDVTAPRALRAFATDSVNISLVFDEPLDSARAVIASNYNINQAIGTPRTVALIPPLFNTAVLRLGRPIERNRKYLISIKGVNDCSGNPVSTETVVASGLPSLPGDLDVVINEILFNPRPGGSDYVELYNRSNRIVDLKELYLAGKSSSGTISSLKPVTTQNHLLFPQDYVVITESPETVQQQYATRAPDAFVETASMPSMPDETGTVLLLNSAGKVIDALTYDEKWHFKLIDNDAGIALERIDYNKSTQDAANWHSASSTSGYGTPGFQNSQFRTDLTLAGEMKLNPVVFSPDNDGLDDFTTIDYAFPEPGYVCNISLYDATGRCIRHLAQNAICGTKGYFRWDGLDDKNTKPPIGVYVMIAEVFNLQGKTKKFKQAVVVATRLR